MMETHEFVGAWYLPNDFGNHIFGTLKFDPKEGAVLELMGSFVSFWDLDSIPGELPRLDLIHGVASGKLLTLRDCAYLDGTDSIPGIEISRYRVSVIFAGHHFQQTDQIKFKEMLFQFSNLNDWLSLNLFSRNYSDETRLVTIECVIPKPVKLLDVDGVKVELNFLVNTSGGSETKKVTTQWTTSCDVTVEAEKTLDDFLELISGFKNLISLSTKKAVRYTSIRGLVEDETDDVDALKHKTVEIFFGVADFIPFPTEISTRHLLFPFFTLYNSNPDFLKAWLNRYDELKDVLQLFFGIYHNPNMFLQQKFLSAIQSLESYHRRSIQNTDLLRSDHKKRLDSIFNSVPEEHREWLSEKLNYSYEPNLRKRLNEIWANNQEVLSKFFNSKTKAKIIEMATVNRNYLTHFDISLQDRKATPAQMYDLTSILMMLMIICLLRELGFDSQKTYELISSNHEYTIPIKRFKTY